MTAIAGRVSLSFAAASAAGYGCTTSVADAADAGKPVPIDMKLTLTSREPAS
jgi:hypothetical protein